MVKIHLQLETITLSLFHNEYIIDSKGIKHLYKDIECIEGNIPNSFKSLLYIKGFYESSGKFFNEKYFGIKLY